MTPAISVQVRLSILSFVLIAAGSCASRDRTTNTNALPPSASNGDEIATARNTSNKPCLNLNLATADELIKLPGIGETLAKRIIDYRERHGRFRRPQEIIIIEGFSESKYRAIASIICVE